MATASLDRAARIAQAKATIKTPAMLARERRAAERAQVCEILASGATVLRVWNCDFGVPEIGDPQRLVIAAPIVQDAMDAALLSGRIVRNPLARGLARFASDKPAIARPFRFLACESCNAFGGIGATDADAALPMNAFRVAGTRIARKWQMAKTEDTETAAHEALQWKRETADTRVQAWQSSRDEMDRKPYRGPSMEEQRKRSDEAWQAELARVQTEQRNWIR